MNAASPLGFAKDLRERIATVIAGAKAYDVPAMCRRYGLADGDEQEAFASKYRYAHTRLQAVEGEELIGIARRVAQEEGDGELVRLLGQLDLVKGPPGGARERAMSEPRPYYSVRTGKAPSGVKLSFEQVRSLYGSEIGRWDDAGYLQEHFGYFCVDDGDVSGSLGTDIGARMLLALHKEDLWPIQEKIDNYNEDDLFDVIEYVFDHVSKPISGRMHRYAGCGMHWETFDRAAGQDEYRARVNQFLAKYGDGYELAPNGEILEFAPDGVGPLLEANIPSATPGIRERVNSAIRKFRRYRATPDDRRDAVRDLADVLEFIRPSLGVVLTKKDEGDLFNIANNFGIRHHKEGQKTDYDAAIWLSWMFYFYLATIHAVLRLIEKGGVPAPE